jgi:hypothetical protein
MSNHLKVAIMTCEVFKRQMMENQDYLMDQEMVHHVNNCPSCQRYAQGVSQLFEVIQTEKSLSPSPFLHTRIMAALPLKDTYPERRYVSGLKPVLVAACLLLMIGIGIKTGSYFPVNEVFNSKTWEMVYFDDASIEGLEFLTLE